jgi:TrmH family RNA methyltransferase
VLTPAHRDRLAVVLVQTRNPLNIGSVARVMSNFGFFDLRLVQPYDVAFREARSAVGAAELLQKAREFRTVAEAIADCRFVAATSAVRTREIHQPLQELSAAAPDIRRKLSRSKVALLFGSEKFGLSVDDLSHADLLVHIPTRPGHLSLNLAQAVAISLYELSRDLRKPPANKSAKKSAKPQASAADTERMTTLLYDLLLASGYVKPTTEAGSLQKLRRLIRRMQLQPDDAELWQGMLRKISWKIQEG